MAFGFQRTQFYAPGGNAGVGWGDGKARRWLVDEYLKEKRADGRNDLRLYNSILYKGFAEDFPDQSTKYYKQANASVWFDEWGQGRDDCYIRKYSTSYYREREDYFAPNNYRIMRYADILLNYAECIVMTGGTPAEAAVYVDKVRERAGMEKLSASSYIQTNFPSCLSTREGFMARLEIERTLELCFEGWRWADLKRWGVLDDQSRIDRIARDRDADFKNFIVGKHRRLPIPSEEVAISMEDPDEKSSAKLPQNPGY